MTVQAWRDRAACVEIGTELFVLPDVEGYGVKPPRTWADPAKQVCAGCPVAAECLEAAYVEGDQWTVRGGLSPRERRKARPERNPWLPIDHGSANGYQQHRRRGEAACTACRRAASIARRVRSERKASA